MNLVIPTMIILIVIVIVINLVIVLVSIITIVYMIIFTKSAQTSRGTAVLGLRASECSWRWLDRTMSRNRPRRRKEASDSSQGTSGKRSSSSAPRHSDVREDLRRNA